MATQAGSRLVCRAKIQDMNTLRHQMIWMAALAWAGGDKPSTPGATVPQPADPIEAPALSAPREKAVEMLVALPSWSERRERLTAALATADGEAAARIGSALAVLGHLERTGRGDASILRLFLRAALSSWHFLPKSSDEADGNSLCE